MPEMVINVLLWVCGALATANLALLSFVAFTVRGTNTLLLGMERRVTTLETDMKQAKEDIKELKGVKK